VSDQAPWQIYAQRRPVADPRAADYLLPPQAGRRIFVQRIVPDLLVRPAPQARPVVVFLVGQHGAGKTRVAAMAAGRLGGYGGFADLDSDLYKPYHPRYDELIRGDDKRMAAYLGPDSWAWLAQAHDYVRARKINALKPETGQDHLIAARHMRAYREAGFRVEAMILAVPAAMSNQGIIARYHEQVTDRGHGRLPVQANADRAYTGILDLADLIDTGHLADETAVFRRGEAVPRYHNTLNQAGQWTATPTLRAAAEAERSRAWTPAETTDFQITQARLRRELGPEWAARLDEISGQAQPHFYPLRHASQEHEPAERHHDPTLPWNKHPDPQADIELEAGA
jgi:hypothetical protein